LLTGKPRTATVSTMEPTMCAVLEQSDFEDLLLSNPKVGLAMSRVLAERLEESNEQAGIEYVNLRRLAFDPRVLSLLPQQMILQHKILPAGFANNRLTLAMVNPNNLIALDDVRRVIKGVIIEPVVTSEEDFKHFMSTAYSDLLRKEEEKKAQAKEQAMTLMKSAGGEKAAAEVAKLMAQSETMEGILESLQNEALKSIELEETPEPVETVTDLSTSAEEAPIIRLANNILALAIKKGASDIHVEPQEKEVVVRLRIDGALQPSLLIVPDFSCYPRVSKGQARQESQLWSVRAVCFSIEAQHPRPSIGQYPCPFLTLPLDLPNVSRCTLR